MVEDIMLIFYEMGKLYFSKAYRQPVSGNK